VLDRVAFVTSSEHKHREAQGILGLPLRTRDGSPSASRKAWTWEDREEKAHEAHRRSKPAVLVEDTSLELAALGASPDRWSAG